MAMVMDLMDTLIGLKCKTFVRRDGDGNGHSYRIEVVMHVIDVMAMVIEVMDILLGFKL